MAFTLEQIVPWGRSLDEYVKMFALTEDDLNTRIVGCGDGPASFNAEMCEHGHFVVSVDPIYQFSAKQIENRIEEVYEEVMGQVLAHQEQFVWNVISSPEELGQIRMTAMRRFVADLEQGKRENRYQTAELPNFPFEAQQFDLALCSHVLFLYSEHLSLDFHRRAIAEMCRVAREVRIFPLVDLRTRESAYIIPILAELKEKGFQADIQHVPYEFQRGGNQMMRIVRG